MIGTIYPYDAGERLFSRLCRGIFLFLKCVLDIQVVRTEERRINIILSVAVVMVINALMTRRLNGDNMPLMTPSVTLHKQYCAYDDVAIGIKALPRSLRICIGKK